MANQEHVDRLREGNIHSWNEWRARHPQIRPDFSNVNFRSEYLGEMDLKNANFENADLVDCRFHNANLEKADFSNANLEGVYFFDTNLTDAVLENADLDFARIEDRTRLCSANLTGASLYFTIMHGVFLDGANFSKASFGHTSITDIDLSEVKGLDEVIHTGPSTIGIDTLYNSHGKIHDDFLLGAGVPQEIIDHILPSIRSGPTIQCYSCFISYSTEDEKFAERLHSRMRQAGMRVWFAPEDMKGGDHFFEQIERAIQLHDRLLLVLSRDSIKSKWVEREIKKARKVERQEKRKKLFPISLVRFEALKKWECLDTDTGEDLAEEVRKYHIPNFSNWKEHDAFEEAFSKLEKDLRTSITK